MTDIELIIHEDIGLWLLKYARAKIRNIAWVLKNRNPKNAGVLQNAMERWKIIEKELEELDPDDGDDDEGFDD